MAYPLLGGRRDSVLEVGSYPLWANIGTVLEMVGYPLWGSYRHSVGDGGLSTVGLIKARCWR